MIIHLQAGGPAKEGDIVFVAARVAKREPNSTRVTLEVGDSSVPSRITTIQWWVDETYGYAPSVDVRELLDRFLTTVERLERAAGPEVAS